MKKFVVCTLLLAVVPMFLLNPAGGGRAAFLGYYLGVIATWLVFLLAGAFSPSASRPAEVS